MLFKFFTNYLFDMFILLNFTIIDLIQLAD